jgi:hypothetical protein
VQRLHRRLAAILSGRTAFLGRMAAELGLDPVELPDPTQRLLGQRRARARGLVDLVKASSARRPAEREPDLTRASARQQAFEPAVAVHLQHALEVGQMRGRALALAVLGIEKDHRRRGGASPCQGRSSTA